MSEPDQLPDENSKSVRKKEMLALQKLGEALVQLTPEQTAKIPLDEVLIDAINVARTLKTGEAKRRQFQFIGKLMRHRDSVPIAEALAQIQLRGNLNKVRFQQMERWREQLLTDPEACEKFITRYNDVDIQYFRQLVMNAKKEQAVGKPVGAETALFRYIRECLEKDLE